MGRIYRVNPTCPHCWEEHMYWNVRLTDEEQAVLDKHTEEHKGESTLLSLLSDPGLVITRELKCGCCKETFIAELGIRKEMELGYQSPDLVPMGTTPLL